MAFILNIETSTKNCSVALAKDGVTLSCVELSEEGYSHAEKLHLFIEEVLRVNNLSTNDLQAIAVSQGPGSYTGLRIGVSAAKGLAYALNLPLIAIDTLQTLASQARVTDGLIVPMLDARRMEVYSAVFDSDLKSVRSIVAEIISEESFTDFTQNLYFVGDCAEKCMPVLNNDNHIFLENIKYPTASAMSPLSFAKYTQNEFVDVAYFEPYYLKDFVITTAKKS